MKVTSIDVDADVLGIADQFHEALGVTVESVVRDGTATGFEDDSFDAVYSQGLWEHFTDENIRSNFAKEGLRLAPVVYASVPSFSYPAYRSKRSGSGWQQAILEGGTVGVDSCAARGASFNPYLCRLENSHGDWSYVAIPESATHHFCTDLELWKRAPGIPIEGVFAVRVRGQFQIPLLVRRDREYLPTS